METNHKHSMTSLAERLEHRFKDPKHLELALMHSSYAKEKKLSVSNERLEFLGDSVFNMVTVSYLYQKFPKADEGKLSKLKSMLVSKKSLLEFGYFLELENHVLMGTTDFKNAKEPLTTEKENVLANAAEAVIGALYLDGGFDVCAKIIQKWLSRKKRLVIRDYKSRLQEVIQKLYKRVPDYLLARSWGPEHSKTFEVEAKFGGKILGSGVGKNKKEAEQAAAKDALLHLKSTMK